MENCPPSRHIYEYFFISSLKYFLLGIPISELLLYFPDKTLSYLSNLNWSSVKIGFGNNWNIFAVNNANGNNASNENDKNQNK